jgi:transcription initiation factor IIE alpha subunit
MIDNNLIKYPKELDEEVEQIVLRYQWEYATKEIYDSINSEISNLIKKRREFRINQILE